MFMMFSILSVKFVNGSKILAIFPIPLQEHQVVYRPLIQNLLNNGHEITLLTTNPYFTTNQIDGLNEYQNITEIDLSFVYSLDILKKLNDGDLDGSEMLKTVFEVMRQISEAELTSPQVKELLDHTEYNHFDVVLVEWSGSASLHNIFAYKYDIPLIAITNGDAFPNIHEAFGNPNHPIIFPSTFLPFSENLNIIQRISSVLFTIWYR
jgi:glucuronosyltransferase